MIPRCTFLHVTCGLMLLAAPPVPRPALAAVTVTAAARDSLASPDGNGRFSGYSEYGEPCINDFGQVAFTARLTGTALGSSDNDVLVRVSPGGLVQLLARQGSAIPDGPGFWGDLQQITRQYAMNDSGRVAFNAPLTGTSGGPSNDRGIYSASDPGAYWIHVRKGDIAPFTTLPFNALLTPQINDQPGAAVAFYASIGTTSIPGVAYVSRYGVLYPVAYTTQPAPDETDGDGINGTIGPFPDNSSDPPSLRKNAAEVALYAHCWGTTSPPLDDDGIFRATAGGSLADCARGHQPAPGGGTYQEFNSPVYNANGIAAFQAYLNPVPSAGEILALDWPMGGDLIAFSGEAAADGNGRFASFDFPSLNNHEAVAFRVALTGTAGGGLDDVAVYRSAVGRLPIPPLEDQIAREGQAPPEGNGTFADFGTFPAINDSGQVLFTATLRGTAGGSTDDHGIYLWDPAAGVTKLLREGDSIDGRTVLAFSTMTERDHGGFRSLNNRGEAVARVDCSGVGRDGVYVLGFTSGATAVRERTSEPFALRIAPNPARRDAVTVSWTRGAPARDLRVEVVDVLGRRVRLLREGPASSEGSVRWDLRDAAGRVTGSGLYFVRVIAPEGVASRRVVRLN
ncbi:MAG: choice-of-anchor tandem repeat NxxGxxAF-containing protein [bacterium]